MTDTTDKLRELQRRLDRAAHTLIGLIESGEGYDQARLRGKYEGVRLAESYLAELLREETRDA